MSRDPRSPRRILLTCLGEGALRAPICLSMETPHCRRQTPCVTEPCVSDRSKTILTETVIRELRRDADRVVSGVVLQQVGQSEQREVKVREDTVLATGYFSANDEMARAHGRPAEHGTVGAALPPLLNGPLLL